MSTRGPKADSLKAARAKEKRQQRKPGAYLNDGTKIRPRATLHPFYDQPEDDTPVEPVIIKSPSRRYERNKR
jgi:hypothetical protein